MRVMIHKNGAMACVDKKYCPRSDFYPIIRRAKPDRLLEEEETEEGRMVFPRFSGHPGGGDLVILVFHGFKVHR